MSELNTMGYRICLTSFSFPEQYDVFDKDNNKVGYFRLRHSEFNAECVLGKNECVYYTLTQDSGCFIDSKERHFHITNAIKSLDIYIKEFLTN